MPARGHCSLCATETGYCSSHIHGRRQHAPIPDGEDLGVGFTADVDAYRSTQAAQGFLCLIGVFNEARPARFGIGPRAPAPHRLQ
jgi:hypothetical protein